MFPSLSVEANLEIGGYVDRRATKERIRANFARFPVLAERPSVGTLQGYEWLGKDAWLDQGTRNDTLAACATQTAICLTTHPPAVGFCHRPTRQTPPVNPLRIAKGDRGAIGRISSGRGSG